MYEYRARRTKRRKETILVIASIAMIISAAIGFTLNHTFKNHYQKSVP